MRSAVGIALCWIMGITLLLVALVIQLIAAVKKFPGRMESIPGETYFGSEQLFNTQIDDVKEFIADFTLPETGVHATLADVKEQMMEALRQNNSVTQLVLRIITENVKDAYSSESKSDVIIVDISDLDVSRLNEIWIFLPALNIHSAFWGVFLNFSSTILPALQKLHIIDRESTELSYISVVPTGFDQFSLGLDVLQAETNGWCILNANKSINEYSFNDPGMVTTSFFDLEFTGRLRILSVRDSGIFRKGIDSSVVTSVD